MSLCAVTRLDSSDAGGGSVGKWEVASAVVSFFFFA